MRGATYRSSVPGDVATATFPIELTALVIIAAVSVSLVSNAVLGYTATLSRNRLAENVLIKRRAWRLIAQKEAAEQANALKSDFISTASHELRTPLHTVSGYTDLLMRTSLSEEQRLYLESIRRACATLNLCVALAGCRNVPYFGAG
jgi:signal transduction histidine kinase